MIGSLAYWAPGILAFFIILGLLVLVHELGHFITARLSGMRVLEFGIGFPPRARVLGHDHETEYTLNYLPIGGFVRLEGEEADLDDPRAFANSSLLKQTVVLTAGVAMNLVTAFLLFFVVSWLVVPTVRPTVRQYAPQSTVQQAGLVVGDEIVSIDGKTFQWLNLAEAPWQTFQDYTRSHGGQPVTMEVIDPNGQHRTLSFTLGRYDPANNEYPLGAQIDYNLTYTQGDPVTGVRTAITSTGEALSLVAVGLGNLANQIASHPTQAPQGVSGPIGIAQDTAAVLNLFGPGLLLLLAAVLSANLALINILPIPPFDGGKLAIQVIKRVFGARGVSAYEITTNLVGFALLMVFLAWISYFDIIRAGSGG